VRTVLDVLFNMPVALQAKVISTTGIELFRAGLQRDSQGKERTWETADLDEMAQAYNGCVGSLHDAPIQVGHDPNTAYGWLERAYRDGDVLKGDYKEVDPDFAAAVSAGRYKKRSISIYPPNHADNPTPGKLNIRHVGYVGIPAVKGLLDHKFKDSGEGFWEFTASSKAPTFTNAKEFLTAWAAIEDMDELDQDAARQAMIASARKMKIKLPAAALKWEAAGAEATDMAEAAEASAWAGVSTVLQALRDRLVKSDGIEAAETAMPQATLNLIRSGDSDRDLGMPVAPDAIQNIILNRLDMLTQNIMNLQSQLSALQPTMSGENYAEQKEAMADNDKTAAATEPTVDFSAQIATLQTQQEELRQENTQLKAQVTVLSESRANIAAERERERVSAFVEALASNDQRKLLPSDVPAIVELALALPNATPQDFTEGDATVSVTPRQRYLDRLTLAKPLWSKNPMQTGPEHAPSENAIVNFNAAPGYTVDQESAQLHNQAVAYCQKQGWNFKEEEKYTAALIAITDGAQ
jgi:hypothetical protein